MLLSAGAVTLVASPIASAVDAPSQTDPRAGI
jgi:hypothetical protein